jgi:hypothetical protein
LNLKVFILRRNIGRSPQPEPITRGLKNEALPIVADPVFDNGGSVMFECRADDVLEELFELLKLEKIEENIFRGQSQVPGFGHQHIHLSGLYLRRTARPYAGSRRRGVSETLAAKERKRDCAG